MQEQSCGRNDIVSASFSIHPMSDDFIDIILGALEEVDTSNVWSKTDDVSTSVRGTSAHVFDVTKALFMHAAKTGKHVAFQATYSCGCPGGSCEDANLEVGDIPVNNEKIKDTKQYVAAKFSLYPLGGGNYMDLIYQQIEAMKAFVTVSSAPLATRLEGEAIQVFNGLEKVFNATVEGGSSHNVMTVSISANSPSHN
ncbi:MULTISPECIES: YkoF family thiamine/hydroxymethylpyrimidine-binding protein [Bacillaceae]|uniref:HMP/thiamine-binding protein YkoF n=1 Tax=Ornithinibacillus halotolerans TaxID=1274357 RepID=A0A916W5W8_9BACI|nr:MULTISPECIES: YkoF family thiamine/hydroxymethylpyrimidine-binding protein [Bacillaceae]GGA69480.1 putative HMP/thiamine-binding protein YkoF [Ornithinibacillus halotolerans]